MTRRDPGRFTDSPVSSLRLAPDRAWLALTVGLAAGLPASLLTQGPDGWASLPLAICLSWASMVDLERMILPDAITLGLVMAGLLLSATKGSPALLEASIGAAAGYLSLAGVAAIYVRIRGRHGLGLGDAKLLAAAGAWLGWTALPLVVLAGSLGALIVVVGTALLRGRLASDAAFPFGPFLSLAFFVLWATAPWPLG